MELQVPVLRRVVEAILVFDHGFTPEAVTTALDNLRTFEFLGGNHIIVSEFESGSETCDLYSYKRGPTKAELKFLHAAYAERRRVLSNSLLKTAGERYVRAAILKSGNYQGVTRVSRLGKITDGSGKNALDMLATLKTSRVTFGISVKNQHAWLFPGDKSIKDVYAKAAAHGVKPWLVVPFATKDAQLRCQHDGIKLSELHRQVVPAEDRYGRPMELTIRNLRSVIGPQPFRYLYARASRSWKDE